MEAVLSPETSVNFYQTVQIHAREDNTLHIHLREDLKSNTLHIHLREDLKSNEAISVNSENHTITFLAVNIDPVLDYCVYWPLTGRNYK
jgi:hypothetical protein